MSGLPIASLILGGDRRFCLSRRRTVLVSVVVAARARAASSADVLDDLDELVEAVAVVAGEVDEFLRALDDGAAFGCA
jgi:DNA-binding MarR family transcriptional regulator